MENHYSNVWHYCSIMLLFFFLFVTNVCAAQQKYRICVTEKSNNKKHSKYCPLLEKAGSKASCVFGHSRLDCLIKIIEGKADFGIFEAEDILIAANYKNADVLVTNEVRYLNKPYAYEMFAVVRKHANITKISQLEGKNFCHTGYVQDADWTELFSKYFEARVVPQVCAPDMCVFENHLKSSSQFFKAACKAGPWVSNSKLDTKLKQTYPNLCKLCDDPLKCSTLDKYWGRVGPLYCLTDGAGDIAWARSLDIEYHFGIGFEEVAPAPASDYNFLCADDRLAPLNQPENCAWIARPWPAVVTRRKYAEAVQQILSNMKTADQQSWQWSVEELLEIHAQTIIPLESMMIPEDYLQKAPGFLSATSLAHCEPAGKIYMCAKSNAEMSKCEWLTRAATAYGIEPQLECLLTQSSTKQCLQAVQKNTAHVVTVQPDDLYTAYREFGLKPILYEYAKNLTYIHRVAAVVKKSSPIKSISDLKGKKACFTVYEGVGWNSILSVLRNKTLVPSTCSHAEALAEFFSESCVPGINKTVSFPSNLETLCESEFYNGEVGAFQCLASGKGDVAFIDLNTIKENTDGVNTAPWARHLKAHNFRSICLDHQSGDCYLSWATPGQILINTNTSVLKEKEIVNALMELGNLFGKHHKAPTAEFQIFAPFDDKSNVLFHDVTYHFEDYTSLQQDGMINYNYEKMIETLHECSSAHRATFSSIISLAVVLFIYLNFT